MPTSSATFDTTVFEAFDPNYKASSRSVTDFPGTFGRGQSLDLKLLK